MQEFLIDLLVCPVCHGYLTWSRIERGASGIEEADVVCSACAAGYGVRVGIGVFLTPALARNDLWEAVGGLESWLRAHPDADRHLMGAPVATLNAADRLLRAFACEERGDFTSADAIAPAAMRDLYTEEYRACWEHESRWLLDNLAGAAGPIVDLASGRGYLVERMARELRSQLVATDFSPRVLRRDRARLRFLGLEDRVSLLAFDARRSPFRDGAVSRMTSNLGLANIERPGTLALELRRILAGTFLSIMSFYPEDDGPNADAIRGRGGTPLLFRRPALRYLSDAGLRVEVLDARTGVARPTPRSMITGAPIDLLPVAETVLEWCVLAAS